MRVHWFPVLLGFLLIVLVSVPYILAYQNTGEVYKFGGFLQNPVDGNTYLAKMYQGWQGSWRFSLPFTVEPGDGGYLFLFYLALGHLARISGVENQIIYHTFRIAGTMLLVISLWYFFGGVFKAQRARRLAFGLALFGSGMGWLVTVFGVFSADFWVAEGYVFLSAYSNPHFPLGLAIMLWFLSPQSADNSYVSYKARIFRGLIHVALGFILAIVMPFGLVICGVVLAGLVALKIFDAFKETGDESGFFTGVKLTFLKTGTSQKLILMLIGSMPVLLYQLWIASSDPVLAAWNAQNITISPPIWELIIAYSPLLLFAVAGFYCALKTSEPKIRVLLLWSGLGLVLLYVPWGLQRRFISGYIIPLVGLAAISLDYIFAKKRIFGVAALVMVIVLMIPTNLMIIVGGIQAVNTREESILLSKDEYLGLQWIEANTVQEAVILSSPEMGLLIPAYTGRRVWYGHPFETPDAERMQVLVESFFSGRSGEDDSELLRNSDFLFYGSRERELGVLDMGSGFELVFESGEIRIYRIEMQGLN